MSEEINKTDGSVKYLSQIHFCPSAERSLSGRFFLCELSG